MGKYFGTDGIRGKANQEPITPHTIITIAQALGIYLKRTTSHPTVVVGKDTRVSGYIIENALASGLASVGVDIVFLGPIPTPAVAYFTVEQKADAGIVISASHNPYHDNGIKFFDQFGFKFSDEAENALEILIDTENFNADLVSSHDIGMAKRIDDASFLYATFLANFFDKTVQCKNKKIILDCANGAAYKVAPQVFELLGIECTALHTEPDGFNINHECGAVHPQDLQKAVLEQKADIGFSFDGDADRLIVVDEKGNLIDGDQIIALCALSLKRQNKLPENGVCVTIMSNKGLDIALEKEKISIVRTPVGDRAIANEMRKRGFTLGGEQSGHILFLDASTTGDGILAALKVLEVFCTSKNSISEIAQVMTKLPQITKNVPVSCKPALESLTKTSALLKDYEKKLENTGRVFIRYSGTEPCARITAEGPTYDELQAIITNLEKTLKKELKNDGLR